MKFIPYLLFDGCAEEALNFYADALIGTVGDIMRYKENPDGDTPVEYEDKVLHAELDVKGETLYFSDCFPGSEVKKGDQISINISIDTLEEIESVYNKLKVKGKIIMPLEDTFWGAKFASLIDQYDISWSLNYQYPEKE